MFFLQSVQASGKNMISVRLSVPRLAGKSALLAYRGRLFRHRIDQSSEFVTFRYEDVNVRHLVLWDGNGARVKDDLQFGTHRLQTVGEQTSVHYRHLIVDHSHLDRVDRFRDDGYGLDRTWGRDH